MKRQNGRFIFQKMIAILAAALLVFVQLSAAAFCFAEDYSYRSVRDENMFIEVPKSWEMTETGSIDEDAKTIEEEDPVFKVLELQNQDKEKQGELWICADPFDNSNYYCNSEEEAENYLDECGDEAIESVIEYAFPDATEWSRGDPAYLKGENDFTYVIRQNGKVEGKNYLFYLSCDFTKYGGVHEVLIFNGAADKAVCDRIAESLEGFSYAGALVGDGSYSGGDDNSDNGPPDYYEGDDTDSYVDVGDLFFTLVSVFILIIIYGSLRNRVRNGVQRGKKKPSADPVMPRPSIDGLLGRKPAKRAIDKWTLREKRNGTCNHEDMHIQTGTKYSGYQESLRTLHKSGLLTTKEMNELLEKHKDDF